MIKISFGMIVLNGDHVLQENLESLYPYAHQIVIAEGPVEKYQKLGYIRSTDKTIEIIKNFPDPDKKIILIQGQWPEKDEMCNAYVEKLTGDYVWHVDADEIYKPQDMELIIKYLTEHPECHSMSFRFRSFYGGFERYVSGFDENFETHRIKKIIPGKSRWVTHRPPTMKWPLTGEFCEKLGHVNQYTTDSWGIRIYHYSYVFPSQVASKINYYYSISPDGVIKDYFNSLFIPWMLAKTDAEKELVEKPTNGVHEWLPDRRGDASTKKFIGEHPDVIKKSIPKLNERIQKELEYFINIKGGVR